MIRSLLLALALTLHAATSAAEVKAEYRPLGANDWTVNFTVQNDGTLSSIGGFTIFFPEAEFSALSLIGAPATWDSLVVQPDLGIPAAGFLDSFAIDVSDRLASGDSVGGFEIGFMFLGAGAPGRLAFDIVDSNFQVVFSGFTAVSVVPEPPMAVFLVLGLGLVLRRSNANCRTGQIHIPAGRAI